MTITEVTQNKKRYLPLLLLACWPRRLAGVDSEQTAAARLLAALALVQFGVLMNAMLAVIAR